MALSRRARERCWAELKAIAKGQGVGWQVVLEASRAATSHIPHPEARAEAQVRQAYMLLREGVLKNGYALGIPRRGPGSGQPRR